VIADTVLVNVGLVNDGPVEEGEFADTPIFYLCA